MFYIIFIIGSVISIYLINLYNKSWEIFLLWPFIFIAIYTFYYDSENDRKEKKLKKQNPELYDILQELKKKQMEEAYYEVENKKKTANKKIDDNSNLGCFIIIIIIAIWGIIMEIK